MSIPKRKIVTKEKIASMKKLRKNYYSLQTICNLLDVDMSDLKEHVKDIDIDIQTVHTRIDPYKDVYPCYTSLFSELPQHKQDYYNSLGTEPIQTELFDMAVAEAKSRYL